MEETGTSGGQEECNGCFCFTGKGLEVQKTGLVAVKRCELLICPQDGQGQSNPTSNMTVTNERLLRAQPLWIIQSLPTPVFIPP